MSTVIISHTTPFFVKLFSRKSSKSIPTLQDVANPELSLWSVDANGISEFSTSQIQSAKDFIWDNLPGYTREIVIMEATTDSFSKHGLELKRFILSAEYK